MIEQGKTYKHKCNTDVAIFVTKKLGNTFEVLWWNLNYKVFCTLLRDVITINNKDMASWKEVL